RAAPPDVLPALPFDVNRAAIRYAAAIAVKSNTARRFMCVLLRGCHDNTLSGRGGSESRLQRLVCDDGRIASWTAYCGLHSNLKRTIACVFATLVMAFLGPPLRPAGQRTSVTFVDVTAPAGIRFKHDNAHSEQRYLIETMGAGAAWIDYNNDG